MRTSRHLPIAALTAALTGLSLYAPASAATADDPAGIVAAADAAAEVAATSPEEPDLALSWEAGAGTAAADGWTAVVPADPAEPIEVSGAVDLGLRIAETGLTPAEQSADGAVFTGEDGAADYVVDVTADGPRVRAVMDRGDDTVHEYAIDVPEGMRLELGKDGGVGLVGEQDTELGTVTVTLPVIRAPWAVDAAGAPVPTSFEVAGSTVRQIVSPQAGTTFPVTADPQTCTELCYPVAIYFNKAETRTASDTGNAALITATCTTVATAAGSLLAGAVGTLAGPAGTVISAPIGGLLSGTTIGAICGLQTLWVALTAQSALNSDPQQCLQVDLYLPVPFLFPRTYTGDYCA